MFLVFHSCPHTHWLLLECSSVALTHTGFFSSILRLSTDVYDPSRVLFRLSDVRWCFCSVLQLSARALVPSVVLYSCPHARWSFRNVLHVSACAVESSVVFYSCPHSHWSFLECSSVAGTCVGPFCSVLQFGHALVGSSVLHFFEQRIDTFKHEFHPNGIRKVSSCVKWNILYLC